MNNKDIPESNIVFANNLKYYLEKNERTQKELAQIIKVSQGTVCDWIKGRTYPRMDKVEAIAEYFRIEKSDLIEERNVSNKYYMEKKVAEIAKELYSDPGAVDLWLDIRKLSNTNREIVKSLINSLTKGDK